MFILREVMAHKETRNFPVTGTGDGNDKDMEFGNVYEC